MTQGSRLAMAFGLGSSQALVRLACGFASVKVSALALGPSGVAMVAQLNTLVGLVHGVLGNGLTTGVVRLGAEFRDAPSRSALRATATRLAIVLGAVAMLAFAVLSPWLSRWLLHDANWSLAMALGGVAIAALLLNGVVLAMANADGQMTTVVRANAVLTIASLVVFAPSCWWFGLAGGLYGSVLTYLLALPVALWAVRMHPRGWASTLTEPGDAGLRRKLLSFYPMLWANAAMGPLAVLLVRDAVASSAGIDAAGQWQAAWRISEIYTGIVTGSVSLYFMPRLGQLAGQPRALRAEILRTLAISIAVTACIAGVLMLLRTSVVRWVYAEAFTPAAELMPWQLAGDVLKMAAWICGFVLVAQSRSAWYIALEVLVPVLYYLLARAWTPLWGPSGATMAYAAASACHALMAVWALRGVWLPRPGDDRSEWTR